MTRYRHGLEGLSRGMNASARPIYQDGLVFIINGMGAMVAVRPDGKGRSATHIRWSTGGPSREILTTGDRRFTYMNSDDGIVTCRSAKTRTWCGTTDRRKVCRFSHLCRWQNYCFGIAGEVVVFRPGKDLTSFRKRRSETALWRRQLWSIIR